MIKIRQSYHGTGGKDGYRWEVYTEKGTKLGSIKHFPNKVHFGDTVTLNGELYMIVNIYDSILPHECDNEVIYFEL